MAFWYEAMLRRGSARYFHHPKQGKEYLAMTDIPRAPIGLSEAAKLLAIGNRVPCQRSLRRWITRGVLAHGRRVRLRAVRLHGNYLTCSSWIEEFQRLRIEEVTPEAELPRSRRAESAAVRAALERIEQIRNGRR